MTGIQSTTSRSTPFPVKSLVARLCLLQAYQRRTLTTSTKFWQYKSFFKIGRYLNVKVNKILSLHANTNIYALCIIVKCMYSYWHNWLLHIHNYEFIGNCVNIRIPTFWNTFKKQYFHITRILVFLRILKFWYLVLQDFYTIRIIYQGYTSIISECICILPDPTVVFHIWQ